MFILFPNRYLYIIIIMYSMHFHRPDLTWLMPCHSRWSIGHRQLVSIQLCPALPPPSSSSCIWNPPSTFDSRAPASMCSSIALFLCGLVLSTAVLAWQCCHHSFWACDQASSIFFFSAEPTSVPGRSSSIVPIVHSSRLTAVKICPTPRACVSSLSEIS